MKRADFLAYLNSQYGSHNTFIVLAGELEPTLPSLQNEGRGRASLPFVSKGRQGGALLSTQLVGKYFSSPQFSARDKNFREKEKVREAQAKPQIKLHYKKTDQAHLALGVRTFGYDHKDRVILELLSLILGGSMSSRLFISLRERNGLAYYVRNEAEFHTDSGYLVTRAGVPVKKLAQAINIIQKEYADLKKHKVAPAELKRNQEMLKGRLIIHFEASDDLADWYGRQSAMLATIDRALNRKKSLDRQMITPEHFIKAIEKVTAEDIQRVARDIFATNRLNLAIIGPFKKGKSFEKILKL